MMSFEIRRFEGEDKIFIENQLFDWGLDESSIEKINKIKDQAELEKIHANIKDYFLNCLGEFIGRPISILEVVNAIESGNIE